MASERLTWLDALRLTAGVSMVGLHSTADAAGQPFAQWEMADRIAPLLIRALIYTARTELFLIISIFLLLMALERRPRTYRATLSEQARRLLVPFAFWTVFYAFYSLIKASHFGYEATIWAELKSPRTWIEYVLLGTSKYHMHFLPTLFGLVLFYPFFRIAKTHIWLGALVVVCLLIKRELDVFLWGYSTDWAGFEYLLRAVKIVTYTGYGFVAAALLGVWDRWGRDAALAGRMAQWFPVIFLMGAMLFLIKLAATFKTAQTGAWQHGYVAGYWADFLMPCVLFAGCLVLAHREWPNLISRVAKYSFGIYLCHPIFLDLIEIAIVGQSLSPISQVLLKMVGGLLGSIALVVCLGRLAPFAWTIGLGPLPWQRVVRGRVSTELGVSK